MARRAARRREDAGNVCDVASRAGIGFAGEARWGWEARTVGIAAQIVREGEVLLLREGDARENREERDDRERGARVTLGGAHVATTVRGA